VNYLKRFCAARIQESLWLSWAFVIHHRCSLNAMRLILKTLRLVLCSVFQEEDICLGVSIKINIINNIYYIINVENLTLFYFPNPNPNRYLGWLSLKINVCWLLVPLSGWCNRNWQGYRSMFLLSPIKVL
jgi:hypothetical protein